MSDLTEDRQVLVNLEINKDCQLTSVCGDSCFLNLVEKALPGVERLAPAAVLAAAREVIDHGQTVRHLAITGKEPLDTPDLLFDILRYYHAAPVESRPGTVGIITSGLQLRRHAHRFPELPLDWCAMSLDIASSVLHVERMNEKLFGDLLHVKDTGGIKSFTVNSVYTADNYKDVLQFGKWLTAKLGEGDQWGLSSLMLPQHGVMQPTVSIPATREMIDLALEELSDTACDILFEPDPDEFEILTGKSVKKRWRTELHLAGGIWMITVPSEEGYFVRLRWDGQLLTRKDLRCIGLRQATYGAYQAGRLVETLERLSVTRSLDQQPTQH